MIERELAKLPTKSVQTVITFTDSDVRRECYILGGWNLADDDIPRRPEPDPMCSAQARRAWRECSPAVPRHKPAN